MNDQVDTIAAIATAPGEAGIAIIRISGPDSLAVADRIFVHAGEPPNEAVKVSEVLPSFFTLSVYVTDVDGFADRASVGGVTDTP